MFVPDPSFGFVPVEGSSDNWRLLNLWCWHNMLFTQGELPLVFDPVPYDFSYFEH